MSRFVKKKNFIQILLKLIYIIGFDGWICALQSLTITMISYMGKLRVAVGTEKDYIDPQKFNSCIENAFEMMLKAAHEIA